MENVIFTKFEVIGTTKDEALNNAKDLTLMVDATQAYKKWKETNVETDESVKEWMKDYLKKKKYDKAGLGAYIVTQSGVQDTRERPYKINKIEYDKKTHSFEKFYVGRAQDTGTEIFVEKTSAAAIQASKEWITENHVGVDLFIEARIKEKNALYARVNYVPSKGTKPYKVLAFGYKVVD